MFLSQTLRSWGEKTPLNRLFSRSSEDSKQAKLVRALSGDGFLKVMPRDETITAEIESAIELFDQGKRAEAQKALIAIVQKFGIPSRTEYRAHFYLGQCLYDNGVFFHAEKQFEKVANVLDFNSPLSDVFLTHYLLYQMRRTNMEFKAALANLSYCNSIISRGIDMNSEAARNFQAEIATEMKAFIPVARECEEKKGTTFNPGGDTLTRLSAGKEFLNREP